MTMRFLLLALCCAVTLGGCFTWGGAGNLYAPYGQSFGTYVASSSVNTFCLAPQLRLLIWQIETHFGRKIVMSSGYRDPWHNGSVGGADDSYHMKCMAADIFIPGVDKRRLVAYAYRNGLVGGLGCYPNKVFIHVDIRQRPRGWNRPVTFSGC
jgi:zinc D-Ala-D-Ala carboxypeptidase